MSTQTTTEININDIAASFRNEFSQHWHSGIFTDLEHNFAAMLHEARDAGQDITRIDADVFLTALAWHTEYSRNPGDDARVTDWFNENVRIVDVKAAAKPGVDDFDADTWLSLFTHEEDPSKETDDWGRAIEIMNYQFGRWRRGVGVPANSSAAFDQFERRRDRVNLRIAPGIRTMVANALPLAYRVIVDGETEVARPAPTSARIEQWLGSYWESVHLNPYEMEGSYDSYYVREVVRTMINSPENPRDNAEFERLCLLYTNNLATWARENSVDVTALLEAVENQFIGNLLDRLVPQEPIEVDVEDLYAWIIEQYGQVPDSLSEFSLRNGVDDFTDAVREGEIPEGTQVDVLRRMVRSYGWKKFTGKAGRRLLTAAVASYAEKVKDNPLSAPEWKVRWQRRDLAIGYVSGRYGKEQNMCGVLEQAMGELGVPPVREPKRKVRFSSNSVEVEVSVDSWSTDEYTLRDLAATKWRGMTPEQRKEHVVKYEPSYSDIDFGSLTVVSN